MDVLPIGESSSTRLEDVDLDVSAQTKAEGTLRGQSESEGKPQLL
jgi:hypothetical protein